MTAPIGAAQYAAAETRLGRLLATERDVLVLQGEAILLLEAAARGVSAPGARILNLVSGPYGEAIGAWLAAGGASVTRLAVPFDRALDPEPIARALVHDHFDLVSVVHAEAATGVVNPLAEIAALAHAAGSAVLVDAVASVGAEPLEIDAWDLDLVMIGPQKAPGGPAGVCALVANDRGWAQITGNPAAPRDSILSLADIKRNWIDGGRVELPGYVYEHEMRAFIAMLDELQDDPGMPRLITRHASARTATRSAARALDLEPWVAAEASAAAVATLLRPPTGITPSALLTAALPALRGGRPGLLSLAPGPLAEHALRVNHTGAGALPEPVIAAIAALGTGLTALGAATDTTGALQAAIAHLNPTN